MDDDAKWCFAWLGDEDEQQLGKSRAAAARPYLWSPGQEIYVSYQDNDGGSEDEMPLRARVEQYAREWMNHARITFTFIDDPDAADIRISFRHPGAWSLVGTACHSQPREKPTMNFSAARLSNASDAEVRGVILHEFGHALGLIHEHQQPKTPMRFRRAAVIRDVSGPPNYWSEQKIERNILEPASAGDTNFTEYDSDSIMVYPIPPHWLEEPEQATGTNYELSPSDIAFIGRQYQRP